MKMLLILLLISLTNAEPQPDPNGYIVYCPCMGRFGNQADHFLGSLSFAKALNRTLILPPWVEYVYAQPRSVQIPFDRYFQVDPLRQYHSVITMHEFMETLAPKLWPPGKRFVFCYGPRPGDKSEDCNAKEGNPFGPFWDTFGINFDKSEFYGNQELSYGKNAANIAKWNQIYPAKEYPVLAFAGAPAAFPVRYADRSLQQYLKWSHFVTDHVSHFVKHVLPLGNWVGIHLRNDLDWDNVCKHVKEDSKQHLFASPQCLGDHFQHGTLTLEMCKPSKETIIKQVVEMVQNSGAMSVFVASDRDHMIDELNTALKSISPKIRAYKREPNDPHVSLAILAQAHHFIGNCVSSFSSFVVREREASKRQSSFWAFQANGSVKQTSSAQHTEL